MNNLQAPPSRLKEDIWEDALPSVPWVRGITAARYPGPLRKITGATGVALTVLALSSTVLSTATFPFDLWRDSSTVLYVRSVKRRRKITALEARCIAFAALAEAEAARREFAEEEASRNVIWEDHSS